MGKVSPIKDPFRLPVEIPVRADLFDHRFEDRAVYPAVEAMETLAGAVRRRWPDAAVTALKDIRFDKFLPVPEDADRMSLVCRVERDENGPILAELSSRVQLPSGFARNKVHASAVFSQSPGAEPTAEAALPAHDAGFRVPAERLYRELVPFGEAFQNLAGEVTLFETGAQAHARCPKHRSVPGRLLGNSFVLDAAFHAACAWGQRFAGIVAFPVGIDRRRVLKPTKRGKTYAVRVASVCADGQPLVFAIAIADATGRLCERLEGVQMRDVSAGRWKPPGWIRA